MPGGLVPRDPGAETRTRRALGGLASIINSLIQNGQLQLVGPGQYTLNPTLFSGAVPPVLFSDSGDSDSGIVIPGPSGAPGPAGATGPPGAPVAGTPIWNADLPPASAGTYDDEFRAGSLSGAWSVWNPGGVLGTSVGDYGLRTTNGNASGDNIAGIYKTLPAGDFAFTTKVELSATINAFHSAGLLLGQDFAANPSTTPFAFFALWTTNANPMCVLRNISFTNYTTYSSDLTAVQYAFDGGPIYLRFRRSGATYFSDWSGDGIDWKTIWNGSLPFTPAYFGIGCDSTTGGATEVAYHRFFRSTTNGALDAPTAGNWMYSGGQGPVGPIGRDGDQGEPGDIGPVGPPGPQGGPGSPGVAGSPGPIGVPIEDGPQGEQGMPIPGPTGPQGGAGLQGSPGSALSLLEAGPPGDDAIPIPGPQGLAGATGAGGPVGVTAVPMEDGPQGDDGVPIPGPQGTQGVTGSAGPPGPSLWLLEAGPQGDDGMPIPSPGGGTTYTAGTGISLAGNAISILGTIPQAETFKLTDTASTTVSTVLVADHETSGIVGTGFGESLDFLLQDSTTASQLAGRITVSWSSPFHASAAGRMVLSVSGATGVVNCFSMGVSGGVPIIGFLGNTGAPTIAQTGDIGAGLVAFGLMTGTPTVASANLTGTTTNQYISIQDQKTSGTAAGTATSGSWQTRVLQTIASDTGSNVVSLASNLFTLSAGTYRIRASAPAFGVNSHQIRLQNTTLAATILTGSSEFSFQTSAFAQTRSALAGRFTVAAGQALAIQHQFQATSVGTNGMGDPGSFGTEVYTIVELEKEST